MSKRIFIDTFGQFTGKGHNKLIKEDSEGNKQNVLFFSFHHQNHFQTAYSMFKSKPIIGHGVKIFRFECKNHVEDKKMIPYGCSTHPHNTYLQLLAETGVIGFLTVFFVFLLILNTLKFLFKIKLYIKFLAINPFDPVIAIFI